MKYFEYFGFTGNPFTREVARQSLFKSNTFREGFKRLDFFLESRDGTGILIGEPGCGKTILLEHFSREVKENERAKVTSWSFTSTGPYGLLAAIIRHIGDRPPRCKSELALKLVNLLGTDQVPTILAIDEAHILPDDSLQDLRLLSELGRKGKLLLLLIGQPPLADHLSEGQHSSLRQRVLITHHMTPLSQDETSAYIDLRLKAVGASGKIFDQLAVNLIFEHSQGTPRLINRLAVQSLLACSAQGKKYVDEKLVQTAFNDIQSF